MCCSTQFGPHSANVYFSALQIGVIALLLLSAGSKLDHYVPLLSVYRPIPRTPFDPSEERLLVWELILPDLESGQGR